MKNSVHPILHPHFQYENIWPSILHLLFARWLHSWRHRVLTQLHSYIGSRWLLMWQESSVSCVLFLFLLLLLLSWRESFTQIALTALLLQSIIRTWSLVYFPMWRSIIYLEFWHFIMKSELSQEGWRKCEDVTPRRVTYLLPHHCNKYSWIDKAQKRLSPHQFYFISLLPFSFPFSFFTFKRNEEIQKCSSMQLCKGTACLFHPNLVFGVPWLLLPQIIWHPLVFLRKP